MQVVRLNDVDLQEFADENILGALLPATQHFSAAVGVVRPRESQRHHRQNRPEAGDELIIVLSGRFEVRTEAGNSGPHDADADGPVFIHVPSGVPASLVNIGDSEVRFLGVFAPPFQLGEIEYLD